MCPLTVSQTLTKSSQDWVCPGFIVMSPGMLARLLQPFASQGTYENTMWTVRAPPADGFEIVNRLRHTVLFAPVRRTSPGTRYAFRGCSVDVTTMGSVDAWSITVAYG